MKFVIALSLLIASEATALAQYGTMQPSLGGTYDYGTGSNPNSHSFRPTPIKMEHMLAATIKPILTTRGSIITAHAETSIHIQGRLVRALRDIEGGDLRISLATAT